MYTPEEYARIIVDKMTTSKDERDPSKPLILLEDGETLEVNPNYDSGAAYQEAVLREHERRVEHMGTSIVLNFDPVCQVHQIPGDEGNYVRERIIEEVKLRYGRAFEDVCGDFPMTPEVMEGLENSLRVGLCPTPQPGFNNGEIFLWLSGICLKEDFVLDLLSAVKRHIEEDPIVVIVGPDDEEVEVLFYGYGFRYY